MEIKFQSKYTTISVDKENSCVITRHTLETKNMSEEEYKSEILEWVKVYNNASNFTNQFVDDRAMRFIISPELQVHANETLIAPAIKKGLKKVAFLVSEEIFSQVSIEQAMEEEQSSSLAIEYFKDEEKALAWLAE